jgi:hypothetical protein
VQDVSALAAVAHTVGARFHTDAVQSAPWLPVGLDVLGVDALSLSGHKLGAPKGTGVLLVRSGVPVEPLLHGGGQERGRRSGTEDVAGAVAVATALGLVSSGAAAASATATTVRDAVLDGVLAADRLARAPAARARVVLLPRGQRRDGAARTGAARRRVVVRQRVRRRQHGGVARAHRARDPGRGRSDRAATHLRRFPRRRGGAGRRRRGRGRRGDGPCTRLRGRPGVY